MIVNNITLWVSISKFGDHVTKNGSGGRGLLVKGEQNHKRSVFIKLTQCVNKHTEVTWKRKKIMANYFYKVLGCNILR